MRLKIYEWRASRDIIFEWTAFNDQFTVGADGPLALPFVGSIPAAGPPAGGLAATIGRAAAERRWDSARRRTSRSRSCSSGRSTSSATWSGRRVPLPARTSPSCRRSASPGGLRTRDEGAGRIERELIAGRGDVSLLSLEQIRPDRPQGAAAGRAGGRRDRHLPQGARGPAWRPGARHHDAAGATNLRGPPPGADDPAARAQRAAQLPRARAGSLEKQLGFLDQQIESVKQDSARSRPLSTRGWPSRRANSRSSGRCSRCSPSGSAPRPRSSGAAGDQPHRHQHPRAAQRAGPTRWRTSCARSRCS